MNLRVQQMFLSLLLLLGIFSPVNATPLSPTHPITTRPLLHSNAHPHPPVELAGYDLQCNNAPLLTPPPFQVSEGDTLKFQSYWRMRTSATEPITIQLRLQGNGPQRKHTFTLHPEQWHLGGVYTTPIQFPLQKGIDSGRCILSFQILPEQAPPIPLYNTPILLQPALLPSRVDTARIKKVFGETAFPLGYRFRLGKGASCTLPVPSQFNQPIAAIGVISSQAYLSWRTQPRKGDAVCAITLEESNAPTLYLQYGVSTLPIDYASYPKGTLRKHEIPIFNEWEESNASKNSPPRKKRHYIAYLNLPTPQKCDHLHLKYVLPTALLQIEEIVLLPSS